MLSGAGWGGNRETPRACARPLRACARSRDAPWFIQLKWHRPASAGCFRFGDARRRGLRQERIARQAEARATVLERGGVPLGFNSMEQFRGFGWETRSALARSGNADADVYLRGSAVTGYSYRTGEAFDVGRRSDYDFAIVSSRLLNKAREFGVRLSRKGDRTFRALSDKDLMALELSGAMAEIRARSRQESSIMIYRDSAAVEHRGPNIRLP